MPGTSLQVHPVSTLLNEDANVAVVILAWQYFDEIFRKLRDLGFSGEIIRPILP